MKRWLIGVMIVALFMTGSTGAMAQGKGNKHKHKDAQETEQFCAQISASLQQALSQAKEEKTKKVIRKYIEIYKKKCKSEDDDWSDKERVEKDKAALLIGFKQGDTADRVTAPVVLSKKGKYGSTMTWSSNRPDVISNDGLTIHRPSGADVKVVLTAKIQFDKKNATKSFTVTVKGLASELTDAQRVEKDKAALLIKFNGTDTATGVTQPLKPLTTKGEYGSTIKWYSSASNILSADGQSLNRPTSADANVVLTAIIQKGGAADVKIFHLIVKQQMTDSQRVAADKAVLAIDFGGTDTAASVTRPFDALPAKGANGSTIKWSSSSTSMISNDGKVVNRPDEGDATVIMTAFITAGSSSDFKIFVLTVKEDFTAAEKVAADKAQLVITFAAGDSAGSVTKPIGLPTKGANGSTIVWYSSDAAVISDNGKIVNRPAKGEGDRTVNMYAFISYDGIGDFKTFTLIVRQSS